VTIASTNDGAQDDRYSAHVYTTINSIASAFVSPTLLKKAVTNQDYKQRYCYDTAANRHVFNDRTKFKEYRPVSSSDVRGSTGSTSAIGVGTIRLEVVKYDGMTE